MDHFLVLVISVVFTVVLFGGQSAYWALVTKRQNEEAEVIRRLGISNEGAVDDIFSANKEDAVANMLGSFGAHLKRVLASAEDVQTVGQLLAKMAILGFFASALVIIFMNNVAAGLSLGSVAFVVPYISLRRAASSRANELLAQLPDALSLQARSLQAGLGLLETFRNVSEEMPAPVASEFGRVFEEIRLGREYREALGNLVLRNPGIFDLRLFVSSILLQRETGGNLLDILDNISNTIRERFVFKAKVKAMTSEARASGMILGSMPLVVALLITLVNPDYMTPLVTDPIGNLILGGAICLYATGAIIMYNLSSVDV
jgi:tight adherence protein B